MPLLHISSSSQNNSKFKKVICRILIWFGVFWWKHWNFEIPLTFHFRKRNAVGRFHRNKIKYRPSWSLSGRGVYITKQGSCYKNKISKMVTISTALNNSAICRKLHSMFKMTKYWQYVLMVTILLISSTKCLFKFSKFISFLTRRVNLDLPLAPKSSV